MSASIKQSASAFVVGLIFSIGLGVSGMTQPQKVIGFLDPWGWDPSLLLVMIGAIGVHAIAYPLVRRKSSPLLESQWHVPTRSDLTVRLIVGSMIFGAGWGLGGYCPGPGLTSLASGEPRALVFVSFMLVGMLVFIRTEKLLPLRK